MKKLKGLIVFTAILCAMCAALCVVSLFKPEIFAEACIFAYEEFTGVPAECTIDESYIIIQSAGVYGFCGLFIINEIILISYACQCKKVAGTSASVVEDTTKEEKAAARKAKKEERLKKKLEKLQNAENRKKLVKKTTETVIEVVETTKSTHDKLKEFLSQNGR